MTAPAVDAVPPWRRLAGVAWVRAVAASSTLMLAGCATTDGLAPTVSRSGYDGARVVDVAPHGTACTEMPCGMIGAQWSSARPGHATLYVQMIGASFMGIKGAKISADEIERALTASSVTRFERGIGPLHLKSTQPFGVDLAFIRKLASAKRAWVRVQTHEGYLDFAIIDGATDSKALHALRRFLAQVDAQQ